MSQLAYLLGEWTCCPHQTRELLATCVYGRKQVVVLKSTTKKYRVEACGSGIVLGWLTKPELQQRLKTHQLFLGHNGRKITNVDEILPTFQGPIVVSKIVFRGKLHKQITAYGDHSPWPAHVVWSPDGQTLASRSHSKDVKLWSKEGKLLTILKGHTNCVDCIVWSSDGQTLTSMSHDTIKSWRKDGKLLQTVKRHAVEASSVAWSPNGQTLASGSYDGTIAFWSKDGKLLQTVKMHAVAASSVVWSPDRELLNTLGGYAVAASIAWSPDGQTLVSGSNDGTINLWSKDGECVKTLEGHRNWVRSVAWSPDGQTLASGSNDGTIKLWSKDGEPINTLEGHTNLVSCVAWHPDGQTLASGSNSTIKLWSKDGKPLRTLECVQKISSLSWSSSALACGLFGGIIELWV